MSPEPSTEASKELTPGAGFSAFQRAHWMPLMRRCNRDLTLFAVVMLVYDDTESWKPKRQWCNRSIEDFCLLAGASERKVLQALQTATKRRWITREDPENHTHKGRYRCHPENFAETSLPPSRPRRAKRKPQHASVTAHRPIAALRILHSDAEPPAAILHNRAVSPACPQQDVLNSFAESQPIPAEFAGRLRPHLAESGTVVCPIGLECPYAINGSPSANQLKAAGSAEAACKQGLVAADLTREREQLRIGLMDLFPGDGILTRPVDSLDDFIMSEIGNYPRKMFLAYIGRRQAEGAIRPGLVFHKGREFAREFCAWWRIEQGKRAAETQRAAEEQRRIFEELEAEEGERTARRRHLAENPGDCEHCRGKGWYYPTAKHKLARHKLACNCPAGEGFQNSRTAEGRGI